HAWVTVVTGFVGGGLFFIRDPQTGSLMGLLPKGADWFILAGFAAYAGAGGLANCTVSNWVRDKGMGMAATVGYIPAVVGGKKVELSAVGKVFVPTPDNVSKFYGWWRFIRFDQGWIWTVGCFLGMGLPALLTVQFVIWGCIAINLAQPFVLILLGAFVAGLMMSIYGVQVWYVNRKFLPKELQAPRWRQAALLLFSAFFGFFTIVVILQRVFGIKLG